MDEYTVDGDAILDADGKKVGEVVTREYVTLDRDGTEIVAHESVEVYFE